MASGDWKEIETLVEGDRLQGLGGEINTGKGLWKPLLGAHRSLYEINGEFRTTGDHMLWTRDGWGAILPDLYRVLRYESLLYCEDLQVFVQGVIDPDKLAVVTEGCQMPVHGGDVKAVFRVETLDASPDTPLYCPILDGNQSFVIQGGYYAEGVLGIHVPAQLLSPENLVLREVMRETPVVP